MYNKIIGLHVAMRPTAYVDGGTFYEKQLGIFWEFCVLNYLTYTLV